LHNNNKLYKGQLTSGKGKLMDFKWWICLQWY